jgi:hypothetical protein
VGALQGKRGYEHEEAEEARAACFGARIAPSWVRELADSSGRGVQRQRDGDDSLDGHTGSSGSSSDGDRRRY